MKVNLSKKMEVIKIEKKHFLYIEAFGEFKNSAPKVWKEFWKALGPIKQNLTIDRMAGLSKIDESKKGDARLVYQAGVFLTKVPDKVQKPLALRGLKSGNFAKFLLKGSYHQIGECFPIAFSIVAESGESIRDDFCMEIYLNNPSEVAESELLTEILIPII